VEELHRRLREVDQYVPFGLKASKSIVIVEHKTQHGLEYEDDEMPTNPHNVTKRLRDEDDREPYATKIIYRKGNPPGDERCKTIDNNGNRCNFWRKKGRSKCDRCFKKNAPLPAPGVSCHVHGCPTRVEMDRPKYCRKHRGAKDRALESSDDELSVPAKKHKKEKEPEILSLDEF
jgi:hypothetical protein